MNFFGFNYQLIWVQQDQSAFTNFPQTFDEIDLLPLIIRDDSKHSQYVNPLDLHIPYFDPITFDNNFLVEHSETSDSRPCATIRTIETQQIQHLLTLISKSMIQMNFSLMLLNHKFNTHNKIHNQLNQ